MSDETVLPPRVLTIKEADNPTEADLRWLAGLIDLKAMTHKPLSEVQAAIRRARAIHNERAALDDAAATFYAGDPAPPLPPDPPPPDDDVPF